MNAKFYQIFLILYFATYLSCFASERMVVAVADFEPQGVAQSDVSILIDRLRAELVNTKVFRVLERNQMAVILAEQGFQQSGACNASACQVEMGRLLGVDYVVVGVVGIIGGYYTVSARVLDVETGEILYTVNEDFRGEINGLLSQVIPQVAVRLSHPDQAVEKVVPVRNNTVGDLVVEADYAGASIFLDGVLQTSKTPATFRNLATGSHLVSVRYDSHYGSQKVELASGDLKRIQIPMPLGRGSIKVFASVPDAQVSVDGIPICQTPCVVEGQAEGARMVRVVKSGYAFWQEVADVHMDSITIVDAVLSRISYVDLYVSPEFAVVTAQGAPASLFYDSSKGMYGFAEGQYAVIRAMAVGYETKEVHIPLDSMNPVLQTIDLKLIGSSISMQAKPSGASLSLNGKSYGFLPLLSRIVDRGHYHAVVSKPGFQNWEEQWDLNSGDRVSKSIRLQPTQERLDSLKKVFRAMIIRKSAFGLTTALTATAFGFGLYFNSKADYHSKAVEDANENYLRLKPSVPGPSFSINNERAREESKIVTSYLRFRNAMYGIATAGLCVSFSIWHF